VPHPSHEIDETRSGIGGQCVAGMPQVKEVEAGQLHSPDCCSPMGGTLKVGAAQLGALGPGEDKAVGNSPVSSRKCAEGPCEPQQRR
jgi:hypothetical protein